MQVTSAPRGPSRARLPRLTSRLSKCSSIRAIYVAGHAGLVGSAVVRRLEADGFTNILTATRQQLDLRDQAEVSHWFKANRPEYVFLVAGTVGGIMANSTRPAEFIYDNMMIHGTVVHAAHLYDVTKLLYLGSSCIYPRQATQPITEDQLLTGPAGADQRVVRDRQDRRHQAVPGVPQAVRLRLHLGDADQSVRAERQLRPHQRPRFAGPHPQVPRREGQRRDRRRDLGHRFSDARVPARRRPRRRVPAPDGHYSDDSHINVGTGVDLSIRELAEKIRDLVYPEAELRFDTSKPDGTPRKVLDVSRLATTGWKPKIDLDTGVRETYQWFLEQQAASITMRGIDSLASASQP